MFFKWIDTIKIMEAKNKKNQTMFEKKNGDPSEIRTPDTLIKSQVLCQLS